MINTIEFEQGKPTSNNQEAESGEYYYDKDNENLYLAVKKHYLAAENGNEVPDPFLVSVQRGTIFCLISTFGKEPNRFVRVNQSFTVSPEYELKEEFYQK